MLKRLNIRNFAIIDDLQIDFDKGFLAITGSTGAGKSIIVNALNILLGEKASVTDVRTGAASACIEGEFALNPNHPVFLLIGTAGMSAPEPEAPADQETKAPLYIRREVNDKGQSRCTINEHLVTVGFLKKLGDHLVDFHGQHQHQRLLNPETHLDFLDAYCNLLSQKARFRERHLAYVSLNQQVVQLEKEQQESEDRAELYRFQLEEIKQAGVSPAEELQLQAQKKLLDNIKEIHESVTRLYQELYESDEAAVSQLDRINRELQRWSTIDKTLASPAQMLTQATLLSQEVASFLGQYQDRLQFDPEQYAGITDRLNLLFTLKKKYGGSIAAIQVYAQKIEQELMAHDDVKEKLPKLKSDLESTRNEISRQALELSTIRTQKAAELSRKVEKELSQLGMPQTTFRIKIEQVRDPNGSAQINNQRFYTDESGIDRVEFFIAPNPGETLKPLVKIASGGEISRVMLALKTVASRADLVGTLIFDEIDAGIGGEVAQAVGKKLKLLATTRQVICITHLQQIAAAADYHFKVSKEKEKKRLVTRIQRLEKQARVDEIARMLLGSQPTAQTLAQATEMLSSKKLSGLL